MTDEYPKYVPAPVGQAVIVNSAEEEQAVLDGTALFEVVLSANGPTYTFAGVKGRKK